MTTQPITQSVNGGEDRPPAPGLTATGGYDGETRTRLLEEFTQIASRYPAGHERSALIPMLHLVQSVDGYVSPAGIALCAHFLGLTRSQVSAVATFYSNSHIYEGISEALKKNCFFRNRRSRKPRKHRGSHKGLQIHRYIEGQDHLLQCLEGGRKTQNLGKTHNGRHRQHGV